MFKFIFRNLPLLFQAGSQIMGLVFSSIGNSGEQKNIERMQQRIDKLTEEVKTLKAKNMRLENELSTIKVVTWVCAFVAVIALVLAVIAVAN